MMVELNDSLLSVVLALVGGLLIFANGLYALVGLPVNSVFVELSVPVLLGACWYQLRANQFLKK